MYSVSYEDNFIEPMNVKEFTYDELLRDVPLPNSVLPKVYPFENTDGKITFVKPCLNKTYAQMAVYDSLTYKSTTSGFFLVDQIPANTNSPFKTTYQSKLLINTLAATGLKYMNTYRPLKKGDYFYIIGDQNFTIDGVLFEPSDIIVFTQDCDVDTDVDFSMFKQMKSFKLLKTSYGKKRGYKELKILKQTLYTTSIDSYWKYNRINVQRISNAYDVVTLLLPKDFWYTPTLRFFPTFV